MKAVSAILPLNIVSVSSLRKRYLPIERLYRPSADIRIAPDAYPLTDPRGNVIIYAFLMIYELSELSVTMMSEDRSTSDEQPPHSSFSTDGFRVTGTPGLGSSASRT